MSFFGIGIYHPKYAINQGTLWRSALAFGASFLFTVGRRFERQASDTQKAWKKLPVYEYRDLEDLFKHLPYSCPLLGVELSEKASPLRTFAHPSRAVYLLGAEDHGLPTAILGKCHQVVELAGLKSCLNVAVAGSLVMYDRKIKEQECTSGS